MVSTSKLLAIAAGVAAISALLIFLTALYKARRGQKAAYYSTRREEQRHAARRLTYSLYALGLAAMLLVASLLVPGEIAQPPPEPASAAASIDASETPQVTDTVTETVAVTSVPAPTGMSISSPLVTPTQPPTLIPSPTITPTNPELTSTIATPTPPATSPSTSVLESPLVTPPLATPTRPPSNQRLVLVDIASGIDEYGAPVGSSTEFTRGTPSIYIFFDYRDVSSGALLRHTWFRNGGSAYIHNERFRRDGEGRASILWRPRNGFAPGLYEVRVTLGDMPQFVANFEVK